MSSFKGKGKARSGSSSNIRSNHKKFSNGRSNSVSANDERPSFNTLLPDTKDSDIAMSDILKALAQESPSNIADNLPSVKVLLGLQNDLSRMMKVNAKKIDECDNTLQQIKRLHGAIDREKQRRQKQTASAMSSTTDSDSRPETATRSDSSTSKVANGESHQLENITRTEIQRVPFEDDDDQPSLPLEELDLFDLDKLEQKYPERGENFYKELYAVVSYPKDDLKSELPGEIPDMDFTKAKPPNQVQFSTFSSYVEPYFRQYTEEDTSFLKTKYCFIPPSASGNQKNVSETTDLSKRMAIEPYIIPKLGPLYTEKWMQEDGPNPSYTLSPPPVPSNEEFEPKGTTDSIVDDVLETEKVSCGPLTSRLLSALMSESVFDEKKFKKEEEVDKKDDEIKVEEKDPEPIVKTEEEEEDFANGGETAVSSLVDGSWKISASKTDFSSLDDRLRREFRYVGILDVGLLDKEETVRNKYEVKFGHTTETYHPPKRNNDEDVKIDWVKGREDDEICHELRILQRELRRVSYLNRAYKTRLLPIVEDQLGWQEYTHIQEDLDKQVDQAYVRRTRANNRTKKKKSGSSSSAHAAHVNGVGIEQPQRLKALLEKRHKWITKIGPVFKSPREMKRMPDNSIFEDIKYTPGVDDDDINEMYEDLMDTNEEVNGNATADDIFGNVNRMIRSTSTPGMK